MPGWFGFAKKNEVHQWPESCLGSPGKRVRGLENHNKEKTAQNKQTKKTLATWVMRNDFAHVLRTSTGTAAGGRSKAP